MAETNVYRVLAQNYFTTSVASLGAPAAGKNWVIRTMTIKNTDSASRTYAMYLNGSTGSSAITPDACALGTQEMDVYDELFSLGSSESIQGFANTPSKVAFTITGDEITL